MPSERLSDKDLVWLAALHGNWQRFSFADVQDGMLRACAELIERRAADLELDDYETVNLLWLLRVARRLGLDTGDWIGQLMIKLEKRGHHALREPNASPLDTEARLDAFAKRRIADLTPEDVEQVRLAIAMLRESRRGYVQHPDYIERACATLSKLLGGQAR